MPEKPVEMDTQAAFDRATARAEAAEKRVAELEATDLARQLASCRRTLDQITDKGTLAALHDANTRAEQAEAQLAEAKLDIDRLRTASTSTKAG